VNDRPLSRPHFLPDRSEEDWSALCNPALRIDPWDAVKYVRVGEGQSFLSFGSELQSAFELYDNYNWGAGPQDGNGYFLNRLMAHVDAHMGTHVRVFAELQSGLPFGRNGGPRPVIDRDDLDVSQLFLELRLSHQTTRFTIRAGRQELNYGDGTLVSTRDLNVRRGFDGVSVRVRSDQWRIDALVVKPVKTQPGVFDDASDTNQTFWGVWAVRTQDLPAPLRQMDVYYLGLDRKGAQFDQGTAVERRHTLGFNLKEQVSAWSFAQEGDLQFGTFGSNGLLAWKIAQGTSYSFTRVRLRPVVNIQGAMSSGDANPTDPRLQTFYPLFPRGVYYGYMLFTNGSLNAIVAHPSVSLQLSPTVSFTGNTYAFWRSSTNDGLYSQSGAFLRTGRDSLSRYIGAEGDLGVAWHVDSHTTLQFLTAYYNVGPYLRQTDPPGKDAEYFSVTAAYKF
jgi:alginate export protein